MKFSFKSIVFCIFAITNFNQFYAMKWQDPISPELAAKIMDCPEEFGINPNDYRQNNDLPHDHTPEPINITITINYDRDNFPPSFSHEQPSAEQPNTPEPMEQPHTQNQSQSESSKFWNDHTQDNARQDWHDNVKYDSNNNNNLEQSSQPTSSQSRHHDKEQLRKIRISIQSPTAFLDKILKSEAHRKRLIHRKTKIEVKLKRFMCIGANQLKKELAFINMVLEGKVSLLLNQIESADIEIAKKAFEDLKNIWPWEHSTSFLIPRVITEKERNLIHRIGQDIMQKAEEILASRPDYIQSFSPILINEFSIHCARYTRIQKRGDLVTFNEIEKSLVLQLSSKWYSGSPLLKAQLCIVRAFKKDALTQINETIAHGNLNDAQAAVAYIDKQVSDHYAELGITDRALMNTDLINAEGYNIQENAHALFHARTDSRTDYRKEFDSESSISHAPSSLEQAIEYNSNLLALCPEPTSLARPFLEKRVAALKEIASGKILIDHRTYRLSDEACSQLQKEGIDPKTFTECTGNQLQHALHEECVFIINKTCLINEASMICPFAGPLVTLADAAREYIKANAPEQAASITDFCLIVLDYDLAVAEGIVRGITGTITDFKEHPIETIGSAIYGKGVLVYQLAQKMCGIIDLGVQAYHDLDAAKQTIKDYVRPITHLIDQIKKKQIGLRDVITNTSEAATKLYLQNKVLGGLNSIFKNIKDRAIAFVQNNPLAKPEQYLVTPDGRLLQAGNEPHNKNLNLKKGNGNGDSSNKNPQKPHAKETSNAPIERKINTLTKQEFFKKDIIKKNFEHYRNGIYKRRPNAIGIDKDIEYIYWDHTHNDLEVFNKSKIHIGSLNPETLQLYKGPVAHRVFPIKN